MRGWLPVVCLIGSLASGCGSVAAHGDGAATGSGGAGGGAGGGGGGGGAGGGVDANQEVPAGAATWDSPTALWDVSLWS